MRNPGRCGEVAAAFFVATLSPVLGFIMLFTYRYTFVADHYQYLACIGPIALASAGSVKFAHALKEARPFFFSPGRIAAWVFCMFTCGHKPIVRLVGMPFRTDLFTKPTQ